MSRLRNLKTTFAIKVVTKPAFGSVAFVKPDTFQDGPESLGSNSGWDILFWLKGLFHSVKEHSSSVLQYCSTAKCLISTAREKLKDSLLFSLSSEFWSFSQLWLFFLKSFDLNLFLLV